MGGDEGARRLHIVVQDNLRGVAGRHAPVIPGNLLPGQVLPRAVFGAEVPHVFGIVQNTVEPWRPNRHFEILLPSGGVAGARRGSARIAAQTKSSRKQKGGLGGRRRPRACPTKILIYRGSGG